TSCQASRTEFVDDVAIYERDLQARTTPMGRQYAQCKSSEFVITTQSPWQAAAVSSSDGLTKKQPRTGQGSSPGRSLGSRKRAGESPRLFRAPTVNAEPPVLRRFTAANAAALL